MSKEYKVKQIKDMLGEDIYNTFKDMECFIAGGCITSLYTNSPVNDIDVYFRNKKDIVKILDSVMSDGPGVYEGYVENFSMHIKFYTSRSVLCGAAGVDYDIQMITFKDFNSADEIFETFDFTVCMGAFDFKTEEIILHKDFLEHVAGRYLKFNTNTAFPLISDQRVAKYVSKGYTISKSEKMRVAIACMNLKLESWEDAIEHIGGLYGYVIEEMFDKDKEFSLDELLTQLDNINDMDVPKYITGQNIHLDFMSITKTMFPNIVEELADLEEEIEQGLDIPLNPNNFQPDKYFYKTCEEGYVSWYKKGTSKEIKYEEGAIVNGGEHGIYCHSNPERPYIVGYYWVELDATECTEIKKYSSETCLIGDVKVVRQFEYTKPLEEIDTKDLAWCRWLGIEDTDKIESKQEAPL